ncbi:hypothetical protein ACH5RR_023840 [Cinchona calisaya]|uniref:Uncharacterized protein n=1 Tax=Cinchona calisaya TaxID=153742 RepID=A0ABD2ZCX7_9GENT
MQSHFSIPIVSFDIKQVQKMKKNFPTVIRPDHDICGEKRSAGGIHHTFQRLRMKKKLRLLLRRRWNNNSNRGSDGALIQQQWKWTPPCHTIFKCLIPSLLAVVAVKYQAISKDPSRTRPLHTWNFLISVFLYSLVLFAVKQSIKHNHKHLQRLGRVAFASGVVSSLSLISLLLPYIPSLLLVYTSWALFVLISTFPIIKYTLVQIKGICISSARILFTGPPLQGTSIQQPPPQPQGTRPPV